ncbi:capsular biosynthesis protein [Listeria grandensis]|uniref:YveK family protein n=1 Tax=Listeria grandensis TaxID=1494963 RepID=UPI00162967B7|nr:Wzz/FepE/Etk N-terminal domain-containing protein [Listeria grandensis]MBC1475340.1 capsular biosynthesis protein [Listeria grandensis]
MKETLSIKSIFQIIKRHLLLLISTAVIGALTAGVALMFLITPMYEAKTQILVTQTVQDAGVNNLQTSEVQANIQLVNTYTALLTSPRILDDVAKNLGGNYTAGKLMGKITVGSQHNSQVINVSVQDEDQAQAALIANAVAESFAKITPDVMNVNNIDILAKADVAANPRPVSPSPVILIGGGAIGGMMIGFVIMVIRVVFNTKFKDETEVIDELGIPLLGNIAKIPETHGEGLK